MKKQWIILSMALWTHIAYSQSFNVKVVGQGASKSKISFAQFKTDGQASSKQVLQTVIADLNRSGYLLVHTRGAQLTTVGQCSIANGSIKVQCQVFQTASKKRLLGKTYQAKETQLRTLAHKVADEILLATTGKKGMASGRIAVVSNRSGHKELYSCDMDGKNIRQHTKDRSIVVGPEWIPGQHHILYTSYKRGAPHIFTTARSRPISYYAGLNTSGTLSPNGRVMALILSKDGNPELYLRDMRSGATQRMTKTLKANEASPTWSPDGKHIAYVSDSSGTPQIYIMAVSTKKIQRLQIRGRENVAPNWGPAGIVFCTRSAGRYKIAITDPFRKTMSLLKTDNADYEDPCWAPDNRHIICSRTLNHRSAIYLLDTLEDSPVALLSSSADWFSPSCTP